MQILTRLARKIGKGLDRARASYLDSPGTVSTSSQTSAFKGSSDLRQFTPKQRRTFVEMAWRAFFRRQLRSERASKTRRNTRGLPIGMGLGDKIGAIRRRQAEQNNARKDRLPKLSRRVLTSKQSCSAKTWMADVYERREQVLRVA